MKLITIFVVLIILSLSSSVASYAYYGGYMGGAPRTFRLLNEKNTAYREGRMTRDEYIENVIPWMCKPENNRVFHKLSKNKDQFEAIIAVQGLRTEIPKTPEGELDLELVEMMNCETEHA